MSHNFCGLLLSLTLINFSNPGNELKNILSRFCLFHGILFVLFVLRNVPKLIIKNEHLNLNNKFVKAHSALLILYCLPIFFYNLFPIVNLIYNHNDMI